MSSCIDADRRMASSANPVKAVIAATALGIVLAPAITLYVFLGAMFWRVLLLIACCFVISPVLGIYGMARAAAPVSPNQFLFMLLQNRQREAAATSRVKSIEKIRLADVFKGTVFSILLFILYHFFSWLYGSLFFLGIFLYLVGPVVQLIMKGS